MHGDAWRRMETRGDAWRRMERHGDAWRRKDTNGDVRRRMGPHADAYCDSSASTVGIDDHNNHTMFSFAFPQFI